MNSVQLVGRLTKDPELRKAKSGTSVCKFTLAVNRRFKQEGQPQADFISCTAFGKTADVLCQYMYKGAQIGVTGRIQTGSYDNQQGQRVYTTDVIVDALDFLESKRNDRQNGAQDNKSGYRYTNPYQNQNDASSRSYGGYGEDDLIEVAPEDLPF